MKISLKNWFSFAIDLINLIASLLTSKSDEKSSSDDDNSK